jgi:16S rRNA (cytidine1402-2'-O)-methyltransferase
VPKAERKKRIDAVKGEERTMVFYEAPHKLKATLSDLAEYFGKERKVSLCRELTKLNEEAIRTTLGEAIKLYEEKEPRGEYVLVVEGAPEGGSSNIEDDFSFLSPEEHVAKYEAEGMARMDAIKKAAKDRGMSKSEFYKLLVN